MFNFGVKMKQIIYIYICVCVCALIDIYILHVALSDNFTKFTSIRFNEENKFMRISQIQH